MAKDLDNSDEEFYIPKAYRKKGKIKRKLSRE